MYGATALPQLGPSSRADSTMAGYVKLGTCRTKPNNKQIHNSNQITTFAQNQLPSSVCTVHSVTAAACECSTCTQCQSQSYLQNRQYNLNYEMHLASPKFLFRVIPSVDGSACRYFYYFLFQIKGTLKKKRKHLNEIT